MGDHEDYRKSLEAGFRKYWDLVERSGKPDEDIIDHEHGIGHLPVFKTEYAEKNVIMNPSATEEERKRLLSLIPERKRHKWFRSMSSSQALALSFFGNLVIYGKLEWLRDLESDDGLPAFGDADLSPYNFSMEHEVALLNEPRPTSLDAFISGRYRVAVECKLSEKGFGDCSRHNRGLCDGSLRKGRCAVTEAGARYWDYIPLFFKWTTETDYDDCPLKASYQVVRNVLAACVREDGFVSPSIGHALVIYDRRNPKLSEHGKATQVFRQAQQELKESQALRRISWQRIAALIGKHKELEWLNSALKDKYGIEPQAN